MTRRRFNSTERAALYIAADGKCSICGTALAPGWHADHVHPHSKGGATDVVNGQALCPACNLHKGSRTIMTDLRPWQQQALNTYLAVSKRDFLAVACPGAGKTTWALTVAKTLMDRGEVGRVIVVVPSDALRTQWSDHTAAGLDLRPFVGVGPVDHPGYHGVVTTYQALGGAASLLLRNAIGGHDPKGTLVILDEIHHAADTTAYGESLALAFERARRRLSLTGTPWRTDARERMPFVEFGEDGMLKVDYSYNYGDAVADGVCRRIDFPVVDAKVEWVRDAERKQAELTINKRLTGMDNSDALRATLDPTATGEWLADVIRLAHRDLLSMRREIPDAAGLIVARDKSHARQIAARLKSVTGVSAPVVISAEDGEGGRNEKARDIIERFRDSHEPWIIAVKMIAEGVDIPRLMVGVYATNVSTAMFFNQVVGRFVRVRPGERVTSKLYVPPSYALWAIVMEIQRMLPQILEEDRPRERERDGSGGAAGPGDFTLIGSEAHGLSVVRTHDGDVDGNLVTGWTAFLEGRGIPTHYATQAAASGTHPPAVGVAVMDPVPKHRRERELRDELSALARRVAFNCYSSDYAAVWRDLAKVVGVWMGAGSTPSEDQLLRAIDILEDALVERRRVA